MSKCLFILLLFSVILACNRQEFSGSTIHAPFLKGESTWADSMLLEMTLDEKIGQLFILQNDLSKEGSVDSLFKLSKNGQLGGIILEGLAIDQYVTIVDSLQKTLRFPLLTGTTQTLSLKNQFKDLKHFPLPATISAIQKDSLEDELQALYLRQCQTLGIGFSMTPQLDELRSTDNSYNFYGRESDPKKLMYKSRKSLLETQSRGILAVANSFDDLIYMENDTLELVKGILQKYSQLVENGLSGLKIANSIFTNPEIEKLESGFVSKYLEDRIEFDGILIGQVSADATLAELIHSGADVFIVDSNVVEHIEFIKQLIAQELFSEKDLNEKVYKVMMAKLWLDFDEQIPRIDDEEVVSNFRNKHFDFLIKDLHESAITLAHNYQQKIPFGDLAKQRFRIVQVGQKHLSTFEQYFAKYAAYTKVLLNPKETGSIPSLNLKRYKLILTLDQFDLSPTRDQQFIASLNTLGKTTGVVVVNFGNPLNLQYLDTTITAVQVFERNPVTESLVPQLLFGAIQATGKLPLDIATHLPYQQQNITPITRLKYVTPEEVNIAPHKLVGIKALMKSAMSGGSTPGAQIMLIKNGKVFYQESFGHHTYDKKRAVRNSDLYDLASVTKISATTLAAMKLYEKNQIKIGDKLKQHLDLGEQDRIKNTTIKQLLKHQSGLQANMPVADYILYKDSVNIDCNKFFCKAPTGNYTIEIADSIYMDKKWIDTMWQEVYQLKPRRYKRYKYSDVNFNLVQKVIEKKTNQPLDEFVDREFYQGLNLRRCLYNPIKEIDSSEIVPTAFDTRWRNQILRGHVHDESAALMGGVGGNAGLFSNAGDLGIIYQMLLNGGSYGGRTYLKPETIKYFSSARHGNHRGLGFDSNAKRSAPSCSAKASKSTYGHTGFTGTCVWVDPKEELIFIFLANRIYPDVKNRKIFKKRLRTKIHRIVYDALDTYQPVILASKKKDDVNHASFALMGNEEDLGCID